jgi:hypothetical protein
MEAYIIQNLIIGIIMLGTIIKAKKHEKIKLGRYDKKKYVTYTTNQYVKEE